MDEESYKTLLEIQRALDTLMSGKKGDAINAQSSIQELQSIISRLNQLITNHNEISKLAIDLSNGKLDGELPPRRNYMAGPLKQLHSNLSALAWSVRQLRSGQVISKLAHPGELFVAFNELIDLVARLSTQDYDPDASDTAFDANSWRYHQILQVLNRLHIQVLEVNENGGIVYANSTAKQFWGNLTTLPIGKEKTGNAMLDMLVEYSSDNNTFPIYREIFDSNGGMWYRITVDKTALPNGQKLYIHMIEDVSEWKAQEHQLMLTATVDAMTGAYNRKVGLDELELMLASRNLTDMHCIAFVDLDGLKYINDTFGHNEGDYSIKNIAKILLSSVRASDIVCRYGGDEFFIIFKNCTKGVAEKIISRMHEKIEELNQLSLKPYNLSFSHGITQFSPDASMKVTDLLEVTDKKMYDYKAQHKENEKKKAAQSAKTNPAVFKKVCALPGYTIEIHMASNHVVHLNILPWLEVEKFKPLKDKKLFARVQTDGHDIYFSGDTEVRIGQKDFKTLLFTSAEDYKP